MESSLATNSATGRRPPLDLRASPPGPISTTQSAARMVSSSCSTTMRVLPRSRSRTRCLDRSSIVALVKADTRLIQHVQHPTRPEPIWVASRMRCASPPASVAAGGPARGSAARRRRGTAAVHRSPGTSAPMAASRSSSSSERSTSRLHRSQSHDISDRTPADGDGQAQRFESGTVHPGRALLSRM